MMMLILAHNLSAGVLRLDRVSAGAGPICAGVSASALGVRRGAAQEERAVPPRPHVRAFDVEPDAQPKHSA